MERVELDRCRSGRGMKKNAALGIAREDTIEHQDMKMHVQVQTAKPLHKSDGSALRLFDSIAFGTSPIAREDHFDEDARERCEDVGLERRELAQFIRERKHVLTHGDVRQNAVNQVGRGVGHSRTPALPQYEMHTRRT
jgi:hypothetical protein